MILGLRNTKETLRKNGAYKNRTKYNGLKVTTDNLISGGENGWKGVKESITTDAQKIVENFNMSFGEYRKRGLVL